MPKRSKAAILWALSPAGQSEEYLLEKLADGFPVPALDAKPSLEPLQQRAVEAFWLMNPGRPVAGMGVPTGLPVSDIVTTAVLMGLPAEWLLRVTRAAESVYLDHLAESREKEKTNGTRAPRSGHRSGSRRKGE